MLQPSIHASGSSALGLCRKGNASPSQGFGSEGMALLKGSPHHNGKKIALPKRGGKFEVTWHNQTKIVIAINIVFQSPKFPAPHNFSILP